MSIRIVISVSTDEQEELLNFIVLLLYWRAAWKPWQQGKHVHAHTNAEALAPPSLANDSRTSSQEVHAHIRARLVEQAGDAAEQIRVLYGGSVKADNAAELFAQSDIDGGLIGGASLKQEEFVAIVKAAS